MSPGPGSSSAPASSACSTRSAGRCPASRAATYPLSREASLAKVVQPGPSRRSTLTWAINGPVAPGSTTAEDIASSTTIAPRRPDLARDRAATRSLASTVSSSKDRTRARPHQVELRAVAPRTRVRRGSTIGSGMTAGRGPLRNAKRGSGGAPSTRSAMRTPVSGANLAPWPEHAEAITTLPPPAGARSSTKSSSGVIVNRQLFSATGSGSRPGSCSSTKERTARRGPSSMTPSRVEAVVRGLAVELADLVRRGRSAVAAGAQGVEHDLVLVDQRRPATPPGRGAGGGTPRPA